VVDADPATVRDPSTHRFRFHPIYDWSYRDVWKAISSNGWRYNAHYDHLFRHGVGVKHMRVSNFHHDQALSSLHWLQEVEPETWEAATKRLAGISTYGHLTRDQYPKELPYMFGSWTEYMDYLVEHLIPEPEGRAAFRHQRHLLENCCADAGADTLAQVIIGAVISGDYYGTQIKNFSVSHRSKRNLKAGHG
jgi:predicted phosphoadenosine phosphosulfate sulfurtransferase